MPSNSKSTLSASAIVLAAATQLYGQYAPPPPPAPFQGFINEWLRKDDPYMQKWDFGGSARVRYELRDNFGIAGSGAGPTTSLDFRKDGADVDNAYLLERLRVRAGYTDKWFSALVEGRSSLAQGDERFASTGPVPKKGEGPEQDSIDLHQAYFTVGNHKEFPLSLKVGRQELSYGEERLVGAFAWNNIGRVFDAAKLRWQNEWFGADFFTSRVVIPEDGRFNVANDYDWFSGVYATSPKIPKHSLDIYFLSRNASPEAAIAEPHPQFPQPSARDIYTFGARLKSNPGQIGNWDYTIDLIGQLGNFRDPRAGAPAARLDHEAYAVVLQGGYTFKDAWATPRLGVEYAHGSGDSDPTDDKHSTFENLFPTNHKFYGYMDLFSLQNIHDVRGIFQLKPHPRLSVAVEGHSFWLADTSDSLYNAGGVARGGVNTNVGNGNGYGVNSTYDSYVGSEVDVVAGYAVTRFAQLEAGYGHFFVGDYVEDSLSNPTRGSTDADWVYVQLSLNF
ncbi:MAG: alginate export family protein [Verrucomicrobia subdivision 3 bacterium]|nr:alginate export family protein [Limisphaerales bacterium]